jgi:methionine gamma-lyase
MEGEKKELGFSTRALHTEDHEKPMHTHAFPIFQTSTFYFDSPEEGADAFGGKTSAHMYTRIGNPTVEGLEKVVANLEETDESVAFSSGMAAITGATLPFLKTGDHIIFGDTLYGPAIHLFGDVYTRFGIEQTICDTSKVENVVKAIKENTKIVYLETPANPTNKISDIQALVEVAKKVGALLVVDSTFATPYFQKPVSLGADLVVHSLTKYLNGHGDVVGGIVSGRKDVISKVRLWRKDTGAILAPLDSFLVLRGVKTLAVRMEKHNENAIHVAKFLKEHPKIMSVLHPMFEDFPGHEVAKKQMTGYGSTFSFELESYEKAKELLKKLHLCTLAVSLGNVDTLIEHPASMTHASVPPEVMKQQGMTLEMVRISVGIEEVEDIIEDLRQALEKI